MAISRKTLDTVQGLVDYVENIKPYHSKILEVLEERIHTDVMSVVMTDNLEMCMNIGFPTLNSLYSYDISGINTTLNVVTVFGNTVGSIFEGQRISIEFSSFNDGDYMVVGLVYNSTANTTNIEVRENITSDVVDGKVLDSAIEFCVGSGDKGVNVLSKSSLYCVDGYGYAYDSLIYDITNVNIITNSITLIGDHVGEIVDIIELINQVGDTIGVFHVVSSIFDGSNTVIELGEDITTYPLYNPVDSLKVLISSLGFDIAVDCNTNDTNNSETLFISIKDSLHIGTDLELSDVLSVDDVDDGMVMDIGLQPISSIMLDIQDNITSNDIILDEVGAGSSDQFITSIVDTVSFSWGDITEWFQYNIINYPDSNTIVIIGDATSDIQLNQQVRIFHNVNAGIYTISSINFDGIYTTLTTAEVISQPGILGGFIEPVDILPMSITFNDNISFEMIEDTTGSLLDNTNMIESPEQRIFDIGGFDYTQDQNKIG